MGEEVVSNLLLNVRDGDEAAFETLAKQYRPLLLSVASRYDATARDNGVTGVFADLMQELTLALYRAAMTFRIDQDNVTFGNYAKKCVNNCAVSFLRKSVSAAKRERKVTSTLRSEQRTKGFIPDVSGQDAKKLLDAAAKILSQYEYSIFSSYIAGERVRSIADAVGKDPKSVSNALFRCKSKIRKYFGESISQ